jgi:hypothetical protein
VVSDRGNRWEGLGDKRPAASLRTRGRARNKANWRAGTLTLRGLPRQTKPIGRASIRWAPPGLEGGAAAPNEANSALRRAPGLSRPGAQEPFLYKRTQFRAAPAASPFALREETPCGVTTNTAVPYQTKPMSGEFQVGSGKFQGNKGPRRVLRGCRAKRSQLGGRFQVGSGKRAECKAKSSKSSDFTLATWVFLLARGCPAALAPNKANFRFPRGPYWP